MTHSHTSGKVLRIGPVWFRRLLMAAGWPILALLGLGTVIRLPAIVVIVLLGCLVSLRTLRTGVSFTSDDVVIRNLLRTVTHAKAQIAYATFPVAKLPGWPIKLAFGLVDGSSVRASGVSIQSDALEAGVSRGQKAGATLDRIRAELENNGIQFHPTNAP